MVTTPAAPPPLPTAPSALTATALSRSQIRLNWTDNSSNESGFQIERSTNGTTFTQIATVGAGVKTYTSTGLQSNRTYWFRVRAYNGTGNSAYSNTASARTLHDRRRRGRRLRTNRHATTPDPVPGVRP